MSETPEDGVSSDEESALAEWLQLRLAVEAAATADTHAFKDQLLHLDRAFPMSGRNGAYVWFGIRYQVAKRLQREPAPHELSEIAIDLYGRFQQLIFADETEIDLLLQTVFGFRDAEQATSGANLIVNGAAVLALLVRGPQDLDELEGHLMSWYNEHAALFTPLRPLGS